MDVVLSQECEVCSWHCLGSRLVAEITRVAHFERAQSDDSAGSRESCVCPLSIYFTVKTAVVMVAVCPPPAVPSTLTL
jgi:hypothetical protein